MSYPQRVVDMVNEYRKNSKKKMYAKLFSFFLACILIGGALYLFLNV